MSSHFTIKSEYQYFRASVFNLLVALSKYIPGKFKIVDFCENNYLHCYISGCALQFNVLFQHWVHPGPRQWEKDAAGAV